MSTPEESRGPLSGWVLLGALASAAVLAPPGAAAASCPAIPAAGGLASLQYGAQSQSASPPHELSIGSPLPALWVDVSGGGILGLSAESSGTVFMAGLAPNGTEPSGSLSLNYFVEVCGPAGLSAPLYVEGLAYYTPGAVAGARFSLSTSSGTLFTLTSLNGEQTANSATLSVPVNTPIEVSMDLNATSGGAGTYIAASAAIFALGPGANSPPGSEFTYVYSPGFAPVPPLPEPGPVGLLGLALAGVGFAGLVRRPRNGSVR
jgi:hypothetical protein